MVRLSVRQIAAPLVVTAAWGVNSVLVKYLVQGLPPLEMQAVRAILAALFLLILLPRSAWATVRWSPRVLRLVFGAAFFSILLHQMCMGFGMALGQAGLNSLILSLNPLSMTVLAHFLLGERITWRRATGVAIGFIGVAMTVGSERGWQLGNIGWGELIIFGAMITFVLGGIFVRKAVGMVSPLHFTALMQTMGAIMLSAVAVVHTGVAGWPAIPGNAVYWIVIIASGVFATAYCNFLWNRSIQEIGAARTSIFINLMPLASLYTASLLFAEAVTPARWAGLGAVVLGVYLGTVPDRKPAPQGEQSAGSGLSSAYRA